jgi:plasmid stabilization system protein ParE
LQFERLFRRGIDRLRHAPDIGPAVVGRPKVRVLLLRRFPYKVFYLRGDEVVTILHIRHQARRPFEPGSE